MYYLESYNEDSAASYIECSQCHGTGEAKDARDPWGDPEPCEGCHGYGIIDLRG